MRRQELQTHDSTVFVEVAAAEFGEIGVVTADGAPRVIPVNFVAVDKVVYFHGAMAGQKWDLLRRGAPCSFSMVKPFSLIPSDWTTAGYACPATHLFKSVEMRGRCVAVESPKEKALALQALMDKYQPQGGYTPISADVPVYAKALRGVGVFRIVADMWTAKVKLGQNEPLSVCRGWVDNLRRRGEPRDLETAVEIEKTLADA